MDGGREGERERGERGGKEEERERPSIKHDYNFYETVVCDYKYTVVEEHIVLLQCKLTHTMHTQGFLHLNSTLPYAQSC